MKEERKPSKGRRKLEARRLPQSDQDPFSENHRWEKTQKLKNPGSATKRRESRANRLVIPEGKSGTLFWDCGKRDIKGAKSNVVGGGLCRKGGFVRGHRDAKCRRLRARILKGIDAENILAMGKEGKVSGGKRIN